LKLINFKKEDILFVFQVETIEDFFSFLQLSRSLTSVKKINRCFDMKQMSWPGMKKKGTNPCPHFWSIEFVYPIGNGKSPSMEMASTLRFSDPTLPR